MAINIDELFGNEAFQTIEPETLEVYKDFAREIDGKSMMEIMGVYMKFSKKLSAGRPLTDEEKTAIVQAIGKAVPPSEHGKLTTMLKLLDKVT